MLTEEVKKRLLELLPESRLDFINGVCDIYLDHKEVKKPPKDERQQLKKLIDAVEEAQKALENVINVAAKTSHPLSQRIQKHFRFRFYHKLWRDIIEEATWPVMSPLGGLEEVLRFVKIPPRAKDSERLLVRLLVYAYKEMTGKEPHRGNQESGPIHEIVKILNPVLGCGELAGIIKEELHAYKNLPEERKGGFMDF
jgi:hypothetical protein